MEGSCALNNCKDTECNPMSYVEEVMWQDGHCARDRYDCPTSERLGIETLSRIKWEKHERSVGYYVGDCARLGTKRR